MLNLDGMIAAADMPPDLQARALAIHGGLMSIMRAGANGDL